LDFKPETPAQAKTGKNKGKTGAKAQSFCPRLLTKSSLATARHEGAGGIHCRR